jgi:hypothetical protein
MRGEIRNERYARQLKNFGGLLFRGGITPTDIDGFVEFSDRVFIFIELKYIRQVDRGKLDDLAFCIGLLGKGQRLAYERLCDALQDAGKESFVLLAWHTMKPEDAIPACRQFIMAYRYNKRWHKPEKPIEILLKINQILRTNHL